MRSKITLSALTATALVAATLITALPVDARGPEDGMMMGDGPFGDEMFAAIDADGDGRITIEEFEAWRTTRVAGIDANQDGKLSVEELAAHDMQQMQRMIDARAARRVEMLDTDGDGLLSVEEMAARPMPGRMFARIDADDDGAVTREEIEAARDRMGGRGRGEWRHGGHHMPVGPDGDN